MLEVNTRFRLADDVVEIVHRKLSNATLESSPFFGRQTIGYRMETKDDTFAVVKPTEALANMTARNDGTTAMTVMVSLCICDTYAFCAKHQLRGEFLVLMENVWCETQIAKDRPAEEITAGRTMYIRVAHEFGTALWLRSVDFRWSPRLVRQTEGYHLILAKAHLVETMLVGRIKEQVVSIDKLQVFARSHADPRITGNA